MLAEYADRSWQLCILAQNEKRMFVVFSHTHQANIFKFTKKFLVDKDTVLFHLFICCLADREYLIYKSKTICLFFEVQYMLRPTNCYSQQLGL